MSTRVWYFAYGSNMQPATFAGRRGITPSRTLAARATGWRLVLDKTPLLPIGESFANLVAAADAETYGVLYEISEEDLAHVDLTEGVLIGNYSRVEIAVTPLDADAPDPRVHPRVGQAITGAQAVGPLHGDPDRGRRDARAAAGVDRDAARGPDLRVERGGDGGPPRRRRGARAGTPVAGE